MNGGKAVNNLSANVKEPAGKIAPDLGKLREYSQAKMNLASQLRVVRKDLSSLGLDDAEQKCGELVVKLAEDHFTLAVLGQFKRGKSSLMNAIIGRELLPTGVLPLTSAITTLKYGPEERLIINREGSSFAKELPIESLFDYVTEKGNPGNIKKVTSACVEFPEPFLRRGIEFVDTPGVGSVITDNSTITYGFLPQCDAVIFVTGADTPMTSTELSFLKEIREYVDRVFFVINKVDLVTENERNEVLQFVADTITAHIGCDDVKLFPVSARLGLNARLRDDSALYEQSGLKTLEESLSSFLTEEKTTVFLASIANKVLRILEHESECGAFKETALHERSEVIQSKEYIRLKRDPYEAATAVMEAWSRIRILYDSLALGRVDAAAATTARPTAKMRTEPSRDSFIRAPSIEVEHLKTRGCPVCSHIAEYAWHFFAQWQYQIGSDERSQTRFSAEFGFCPLHTWQLLSVCSPHGASVGFAQLSETIARHLKESAVLPAGGGVVRRLVRDSRNCRVCGLLLQVEEKYLAQLAAQLKDVSFRKEYRRSQGVCLRHLANLLDAVETPDIREFLLTHEAACFEVDAEDMRSYALKREALRRSLENRNEEDAYRRAVQRIVGERNVCAPWEEDGEI